MPRQNYQAQAHLQSLGSVHLQLNDENLTALLTAYNGSIASVHEDTTVSTADIQFNAPWSLDRIDQPNLPLDGTYHFDNLASNVYVYIIDTVCPHTLLSCEYFYQAIGSSTH